MLKKLLFLLLTFIIIFQTKYVYANEESQEKTYTTRHLAEYKVIDYLNTQVKHTVEITVSDQFSAVSQLNIFEPASQIQQISITNNDNASVTSNGNKVTVNFDKALVGPGVYSFTYTYNTPDIFTKIGTSYNLNIPQIQDNSSIVEFNLKVFLPQNLPAKYSAYNIKKSESGDFLLLNLEDLLRGESIVFAENMIYQIEIKNLIDKSKNYIVIPPNIKGRQQVYLKQVSKEPSYVKTDSAGNTYFYYKVNNLEEVITTYYVLVEGNELPQKVISKDYTKSVKNWDYTKGVPLSYLDYNSGANDLSTVENAIDFVVGYLDYTKTKTNYDFVARIGAENINESNKNDAVCLEYTDLLISILRGSGIPTRELSGLAYENDINNFSVPSLHSWVDYNIENTWKQTDPTWQDTTSLDYFNTFDYNHIIFLIRSYNSEYPLLPGSYTSNNNSEQLKVTALANNPQKDTLYLPSLNLLNVKVVKNNTNTYVLGVRPKSIGVISLNQSNDGSFFYNIEFTKFSFKDFYGWWLIGVLISITLSAACFLILHNKLTKRKKQIKSKVSSIN